MQRAQRIVSHLSGQQSQQAGFVNNTSNSEDDIVICSALRTPIGRAKKGSFKDTHPSHLLRTVLEGVVAQAGIDPKEVNEITVGNVLAPGAFAMHARMAMLLAGFPETTTAHTVNRQCSSGLQAFASAAGAVASGQYEVAIAAGVESMTMFGMGSSMGDIDENVFKSDAAKACLTPMGVTSENVAAKFGVDRTMQDGLAVTSHTRALNAQAKGYFNNEIVPVTTTIKDKEGKVSTITVTQDDGPRKGTSLEKLAKLRPAFKKKGTTTAGNSSQVSDGAAAVLLMKRSKAKQLGCPVIGSYKAFSVVGVPPAIMGIGPAVAIPDVLAKTGDTVDDIDVFEINEAFASQALYSVKHLKIPIEKVNPNGGAIALGHPLGCTGARQIATLMSELKRTGGKKGVVSMCIGTGMGAAAVFERE